MAKTFSAEVSNYRMQIVSGIEARSKVVTL
jgi:hypothetical protein